jgi:flagellar biosynthesis GTPase FlhF
MRNRVLSEEDEPKLGIKKTGGIRKSKITSKSKSTLNKGKAVQKERQAVIATWAKRQPVTNLDGIEDLDDEEVPFRKDISKPQFTILDGKARFNLADLDFEQIPSVAQLAVHKKKVSEVSNWLKEFPHHHKVRRKFYRLMQKLLVLSGPAGAGKSTTVQSLAKSFGIKVIEWINPVDETKLTSYNDGMLFIQYFDHRNRISIAKILDIFAEFAALWFA